VLRGLFDRHTDLVADSTVGGLERAATMSDSMAAAARDRVERGVDVLKVTA
jgi:hypothetical protein